MHSVVKSELLRLSLHQCSLQCLFPFLSVGNWMNLEWILSFWRLFENVEWQTKDLSKRIIAVLVDNSVEIRPCLCLSIHVAYLPTTPFQCSTAWRCKRSPSACWCLQRTCCTTLVALWRSTTTASAARCGTPYTHHSHYWQLYKLVGLILECSTC